MRSRVAVPGRDDFMEQTGLPSVSFVDFSTILSFDYHGGGSTLHGAHTCSTILKFTFLKRAHSHANLVTH